MGRAGRSGGGHSSGGSSGSHRSSGGRIGGSSGRAGRSGGSSSHRNSSGGIPHMGSGHYGGYSRPPRPPVPPRSPMSWGPHYGRRPVVVNNYGGGCISSITRTVGLIVVILLISALAVIAQFSKSDSESSITKSTVERTPLQIGSVIETDYYTDELNWIRKPSDLESGMKYFYKKTNVQPYLYITDTVNGTNNPSESDFQEYGEKLYSELFQDEAHLLLIFHEYDGVYSTWYVCGAQAKIVIDTEAADILLDYIDSYYYSSMSEEEMFSTAFANAADRMMTVTKSPWPTVVLVAIIAIIILVLFLWWRARKKQKNLEAEQTKQILNTPLETFGDVGDDADELAKKYSDADKK